MNNKNYNKIEWEKILSFKNKYIYEKYDIDDIQNIYPNQTKKENKKLINACLKSNKKML